MAKIGIAIGDIMDNPNLSLYTNKFAPGETFVKRASFEAGEVPEHLEEYTIDSIPAELQGEGVGNVVYKGKLMPKTAAYIEMTKGDGMSKSEALSKL